MLNFSPNLFAGFFVSLYFCSDSSNARVYYYMSHDTHKREQTEGFINYVKNS